MFSFETAEDMIAAVLFAVATTAWVSQLATWVSQLANWGLALF
jgi:hypothetical protein